jgi:hypothetical protein
MKILQHPYNPLKTWGWDFYFIIKEGDIFTEKSWTGNNNIHIRKTNELFLDEVLIYDKYL